MSNVEGWVIFWISMLVAITISQFSSCVEKNFEYGHAEEMKRIEMKK